MIHGGKVWGQCGFWNGFDVVGGWGGEGRCWEGGIGRFVGI